MPKWSREYLPSLILSGLVLILSVLVLLEWAWLQPGSLHAAPHTDHRATSGEGQGAVEESPGFELPSLDEFSATVEHPLFAENRLPPAVEELEAATPIVSTPLTLKLMGVIFTPRQQIALMQDANGKYKRLRHNDALDGWTLIALSGDRVTLQQGNEQKELVLLKPRPKPPGGAQTPHPKPVVQETGEEESEDSTDNSEDVVNDESVDEEPESPND
ncbi:MAG: hypothetical protein ACR2HF_10530 [Methylococcaceae bacterium]